MQHDDVDGDGSRGADERMSGGVSDGRSAMEEELQQLHDYMTT